jgi:zinc-binding alcohol dehydrogenase family protein
MKAVGLTRYLPIDHPEALLDVELPPPVATGRDLLVEVRAVSVNPVDTKVRAPRDQVEASPRVLGWDAAGVVRAVGDRVTLFRPGDEVYYAGSIARAGCDSELHVVDERIVGRKPRTLGFADAAALPLTTLTAWEGLFDRLGVSRAGDHRGASILLIGGAGGVGSIAIQLARRLAGLRVIATASRPESARWARELGADDVIDHTRPLGEQLAALGAPEVEYIMCLTAPGPYIEAFAPIVKPQGKICLIVEPGGPLPIGALMRKSATIAWELMFTRALFETPDMIEQHAILDAAADLVERGVIRTTRAQHGGPIDAANLRRAHQAIEQGHAIGKIVLEGF